MLPITCILLMCLLSSSFSPPINAKTFSNLTLPNQHPFPDDVVNQVQREINVSLTRRQMLSKDQAPPTCLTGNPVDDCWRCDPNWAPNRQKLADCGIGFGRAAMGGKNGQIYVVTSSSDGDPANPVPGTLRHAVIQDEPLWIVFSADMTINLRHELIFNSFKTVDGRGAAVTITGNGCMALQNVSNIIIHNIHVHHCKPSENALVRASPTHVGPSGVSDGDGIRIMGSRNIWIDHCSLSSCTDGLVDVTLGSTAITVSNSHFAHHDEVMLLGHDDNYTPDKGMQVTVAFNHFGEGLVQRMPRCRLGYIHVVNNDYTQWESYAIGGSANPTINSQGNRYTAPSDPNIKEVTRRIDAEKEEWRDWNWRTEGDIMVNGAFFVPSGAGASARYAEATSLQAKSAAAVDQLTMYSGVFGDLRDNGDIFPGSNSGGTVTGGSSGGSGGTVTGASSGDNGDFGTFSGGSSPSSSPSMILVSTFLYLLIIFILDTTTNHAIILLSLL